MMQNSCLCIHCVREGGSSKEFPTLPKCNCFAKGDNPYHRVCPFCAQNPSRTKDSILLTPYGCDDFVPIPVPLSKKNKVLKVKAQNKGGR